MLYLIGLGLDKDDLSLKAIKTIKDCEKVYLETYTTELPYSKIEIEKIIKKNITEIQRGLIENKSYKLIKEAEKQDIALLVYGDPLAATTHLSLLLESKKAKVKFKVLHNASIFNAISQTGLQLYKFGKTTSIPK